ncbi:MAG: DsrE family protein [Acidiferrobacterales bacterium]
MRYALSLLSATVLLVTTAAAPVFAANDLEPYGTAVDHSHIKYQGLKIVMDAGGATPADTEFQAMVAERIMQMPHAKLIMVIQGPMVKAFSKDAYVDHQGLVERIAALKEKGVQIEFCGNSVAAAKLKPSDMIGIGTVVPGAYPALADAERHGYALIKPIRLAPPPANLAQR